MKYEAFGPPSEMLELCGHQSEEIEFLLGRATISGLRNVTRFGNKQSQSLTVLITYYSLSCVF